MLETLIALGLMLAIGALAIPAVWGRTSAARLDGASRQVSAMIVRCREEAQRRGEPLALAFSDAGGAWLVMERVSGADSQQGERSRRADERSSSREGGAGAGATVSESGALVEVDREALPDGVVISLEKPATGEAALDAVASRGQASAAEQQGGARAAGSLRLVVFMPDGSAVMSGVPTFYVRTGAGSSRALEVRALKWSGGAEVREIDLTREPEEGADRDAGVPPPPAPESPVPPTGEKGGRS